VVWIRHGLQNFRIRTTSPLLFREAAEKLPGNREQRSAIVKSAERKNSYGPAVANRGHEA
jgi:hypothetical protein